MISAVRGTLISKMGDRVVLETTGGVSYELAVPLGVLERLPVEGRAVELKTVLVVREDGWALYGFDQELERTVFQRLLGASGIGPRLALALVSTLGGPRVVAAVRDGDIAALCTVPGIGKKTADRMVLELKDRVRDLALPGAAARRSVPAEQAVQALTNLGYGPADADRAVRAVVSQDGTGEPAELIRRALQRLTERR
ncbi:MAG: Holliday junction branch migration protein RuvA [Gemmatimonadetes bacterium]|nr:Holliday junction branch migration protein RuvA [Gemmatimonadota bacterium]